MCIWCNILSLVFGLYFVLFSYSHIHANIQSIVTAMFTKKYCCGVLVRRQAPSESPCKAAVLATKQAGKLAHFQHEASAVMDLRPSPL